MRKQRLNYLSKKIQFRSQNILKESGKKGVYNVSPAATDLLDLIQNRVTWGINTLITSIKNTHLQLYTLLHLHCPCPHLPHSLHFKKNLLIFSLFLILKHYGTVIRWKECNKQRLFFFFSSSASPLFSSFSFPTLFIFLFFSFSSNNKTILILEGEMNAINNVFPSFILHLLRFHPLLHILSLPRSILFLLPILTLSI